MLLRMVCFNYLDSKFQQLISTYFWLTLQFLICYSHTSLLWVNNAFKSFDLLRIIFYFLFYYKECTYTYLSALLYRLYIKYFMFQINWQVEFVKCSLSNHQLYFNSSNDCLISPSSKLTYVKYINGLLNSVLGNIFKSDSNIRK
jgi:hypothetical protein